MEGNKHFTVIVAGENPDSIMEKYDLNKKVEPYIVYKLSEVKQYKENMLKAYRYLSTQENMPKTIRDEYVDRVKDIEQTSDIDFYADLTSNFDIDEETGNAMCDVNPDGRYNICRLGKNLAMPLIDKKDQETFQAYKNEIQWDKIHLANQEIYKTTWEMIMENRKPETDEEKLIYENMKNRIEYFSYFGSKENYVVSNSAFWGYAFVTEDGWFEIPDDIPQMQWVVEFYDKFIKNLSDNTLISVYECVRY